MASPNSGARATVANASGDAAEDGDALASKRRRLTGADAEPSQADDSVSDGATRRARRPRWRRQTPRDPAEGFDGWHDLPEGILLSVFESLARGPDGRRLVRPAATTARAHPRTLRGARDATQMHPLLRARPNATPVSGPTSPVRSLPFPSHAQLFNCGQVCKAWHDDAMDVLMRDTAVSGRGARRFAAGTLEEPERSRRSDDDATATTRRARHEESAATDAELDECSSKRRRAPTADDGGTSAPAEGGDSRAEGGGGARGGAAASEVAECAAPSLADENETGGGIDGGAG